MPCLAHNSHFGSLGKYSTDTDRTLNSIFKNEIKIESKKMLKFNYVICFFCKIFGDSSIFSLKS